jgi:hypothetical protein
MAGAVRGACDADGPGDETDGTESMDTAAAAAAAADGGGTVASDFTAPISIAAPPRHLEPEAAPALLSCFAGDDAAVAAAGRGTAAAAFGRGWAAAAGGWVLACGAVCGWLLAAGDGDAAAGAA